MRQNFSAQGVHEYRYGQAISRNLAKFHNAVMENSGHKAAVHNLIRGSLDAFAEKRDDKSAQISKSWRTHWEHIITLLTYPETIRKAIYITNAIEYLNSVIRKATKKRKTFPSDESAMKVIYLAIQDASRCWTMTILD